MRIALISDIHGNLEALEAVLADVDKHQVEEIHCLGDVVGYGCDPVACLDTVVKRCKTTLMGNHEYVAMGLLSEEHLNSVARASLSWTADQLSDRDLSLIADFEMTHTVEKALLVHSSPFEPDQWHYIISRDAAETAFDICGAHLCFFGHTHLPMIFSSRPGSSLRQQAGHDFLPDPDTRYLVNVGSVGQPRDNDNRASYVVYDSQEQEINFHRVEYDIALAQSKMTRAKAPAMLIERLSVGR